MRTTKLKRGMYTVLLHKIPGYGDVRVIYVDGYERLGHDGGIKEFTIEQVMNDPKLNLIKRRINQGE